MAGVAGAAAVGLGSGVAWREGCGEGAGRACELREHDAILGPRYLDVRRGDANGPEAHMHRSGLGTFRIGYQHFIKAHLDGLCAHRELLRIRSDYPWFDHVQLAAQAHIALIRRRWRCQNAADVQLITRKGERLHTEAEPFRRRRRNLRVPQSRSSR